MPDTETIEVPSGKDALVIERDAKIEELAIYNNITAISK